jgi:hypothetical protein
MASTEFDAALAGLETVALETRPKSDLAALARQVRSQLQVLETMTGTGHQEQVIRAAHDEFEAFLRPRSLVKPEERQYALRALRQIRSSFRAGYDPNGQATIR